MASLHITECKTIGPDSAGQSMPAPMMPAVNTQVVVYTTASQSAVFNPQTTLVRLIADADAYIVFGTNPTATNQGTLLKANVPEYFGVMPGHRLSVYDGTS